MKYRIMQFSTSSRYFTHFRSKYSPRHPMLEHPGDLRTFPMWQVTFLAHAEQDTKIIVFYYFNP
jgi:hypothetical protein